MAWHGILYLNQLGDMVKGMPTDGDIERLIEEAYPGVGANLILKEKKE